MIEPQCIPLIGFPKAWSPGTDGTLVAPVVYFDAKTEADFARYKGKLKGAIVLVEPDPRGRGALRAARDAQDRFRAARAGRRRRAQCPRWPSRQAQAAASTRRRRRTRPAAKNAPRCWPGTAWGGSIARDAGPDGAAAKKIQFLADEGAAMLVEPSTQGDGGTFFVQSASDPGRTRCPAWQAAEAAEAAGPPPSVYDKDAPKIPPQIVLAKEHYNRLVRMCEQGEKLKMAVDLAVQFHDDDLMAYNTVAEIPGTDLKDEIVMLGGHMDSWHSGTGATDNGAGVSVAMEAMRILKALDLKPRRTIRIALWSGEEEGLLGSRAFVKEHFGKSPANMFGGAGPQAAPQPLERQRSERIHQGRRPKRRPSPSSTSSRSTSTSTTAPARSAASTCRATKPSGRSSASGSSRSARWVPPR